jgi:Skp family chaperone for outer membrane proteins
MPWCWCGVVSIQEVGARLENLLSAQLKSTDGMNKAEKDRVRAENKKLSKDFGALRQKFTETMRQTAARVREVDALAARGGGLRPPRGGGDDRSDRALEDSGLHFQLQQEAIDEHILREREEEIMKINQSVVKVSGQAAKKGRAVFGLRLDSAPCL